jgi:excisionase family DNA binding protein
MALPLLRMEWAMENRLEPLKILTVEEIAELLQVSRRTLHRMIHRRDLPAFKVGAQWRIYEKELTKWLEALQER